MKSRKRKGKGSLEESLSYAMYKDNSSLFSVSYRDKEDIKTDTLNNFMQRADLADIPITRILTIIRDGKIVWRKGQKQVSVKRA